MEATRDVIVQPGLLVFSSTVLQRFLIVKKVLRKFQLYTSSKDTSTTALLINRCSQKNVKIECNK